MFTEEERFIYGIHPDDEMYRKMMELVREYRPPIGDKLILLYGFIKNKYNDNK